MTAIDAVGAARGWPVTRQRGTAAALHALDVPEPVTRAVWVMELTRAALVLGSTQRAAIVAAAARSAPELDVVQRRSGGGAVLLHPEGSLWVDVLLPRDDPLWVDDVGRSFDWLGAVWVHALESLGIGARDDLAVTAGPMRRTSASDLICFAGLGPGEVTLAGRKVIGLSQRRTRAGARFQCLAYVSPEGAQASTTVEDVPRDGRAPAGPEAPGGTGPGAILALLAEPTDPSARAALQAQLERDVAVLRAPPASVIDAFLAALPATES